MTRFDHSRHVFEESLCESGDAICNLCKNKVSFGSNACYCRGCRFNFHKDCLTVSYPKIHEHTLTFIRRKISFPCDVCGKESGYYYKRGINMYACLQCDFYVHRDCIYLPKAIKITRHSHRLSLTLGIPNDMSCRICRGRVWGGYGGYTCISKACDYAVHSYCATKSYTWDGKDVEGEPEEEIASEVDLDALVNVDGGSVRHFSHVHELMRLDHMDGEQLCEACIRPIESGNFLGCRQCDFALHDACANLPRRMESVLHKHPLTIDVVNNKDGFFTCSVCDQHSFGFMYKCCQEDCEFKIDVKCASFVEPFTHSFHPYPWYLKIKQIGEPHYRCMMCKRYSKFAARSGVYNMDFRCLYLPKLVKYKYDTHLLLFGLFSYRSTVLLDWWCEICEEVIHSYNFFYTCLECGTTLHVDCILGKYPYLRSGHKIKVGGLEVEIASNNGVSRPICRVCHRICQDKLVFTSGKDVCFCSIDCIQSYSSTTLVKNLI